MRRRREEESSLDPSIKKAIIEANGKLTGMGGQLTPEEREMAAKFAAKLKKEGNQTPSTNS